MMCAQSPFKQVYISGFMAQELNVDVSEVVEGGTSLAFVAYPTAVTKVLNCHMQRSNRGPSNMFLKVSKLNFKIMRKLNEYDSLKHHSMKYENIHIKQEEIVKKNEKEN